MKSIDFLVSVRCFTFNHANYIEDAMNGFTMQQTDFPFVCVIVDDASTDGESEVIMNYVSQNFIMNDKSVVRSKITDDYKMTFAQHKTNKNCFFAVYYLKYNHYRIKKSKMEYISEFLDLAKYNALCEGDDYWVDPNKLRRQVEFLEGNVEYGMCFTKCLLFSQKNQKIEGQSEEKDLNDKSNLFVYNTIVTPTVLTRTKLYKMYEVEMNNDKKGQNWLMGDYPIWLLFHIHSKIGYINDVTTRYRILPESASHHADLNKQLDFVESSFQISLFYNRKYKLGFRHKIEVRRQTYKLAICARNRKWKSYFSCLMQGLMNYPPNIFILKNYLYFFRYRFIK